MSFSVSLRRCCQEQFHKSIFTECSGTRDTSYRSSLHYFLIILFQFRFLSRAEDPALAAVMGIGLLECDLQNVKRETLVVQHMTSTYMSVIFRIGKMARQVSIGGLNPVHTSDSYNYRVQVLSAITYANSPRLCMGASLNSPGWGLPTTPAPWYS